MKTLLLLFFTLLSLAVQAQNFFPVKSGDKIQFKKYIWRWYPPEPEWSKLNYWRVYPQEINVNDKVYIQYEEFVFRYDSAANKLWRLINNQEFLAFDFNKPAGAIDTLYLEPMGVYTYSGPKYEYVLGENRLTRSARLAPNENQPKYSFYFAENIGLYKKAFSISQSGFYYSTEDTDIISAVIDTTVIMPIIFNISPAFPDSVNSSNPIFAIKVNLEANSVAYKALIDTFSARVAIYKNGSVNDELLFNGNTSDDRILISLTSLISNADSIGIKVICTDTSIYLNRKVSPDSGYHSVPVHRASDSLEFYFFPLSNANKYYYKNRYQEFAGADSTYYTEQIVKDSIVNSNKVYYKFDGRFYRFDESLNSLMLYSGSEKQAVDFRMPPGVTVNQDYKFQANWKIEGSSQVLLFGKIRKVYTIKATVSSTPVTEVHTVKFADGIGEIEYEHRWTLNNYPTYRSWIKTRTLIRGVIGGVEYPTPVNVSETSIPPDQFFLAQNYPNPFNPATKIKFAIPQISEVTLKVFDLLGKEVVVLVNEEKAAGEYEVEFSSGQLSSGIYFYQIRAGNFVQMKKMILMK
jgi:hypothetical protein